MRKLKNQYIKNKMSEICKNYSCKLITPPIELCTDNGIMVANAALERYNIGLFDTLDIAPKARWELEDLKNGYRKSTSNRFSRW